MELETGNITKNFWKFVLPTTGALVVSALYQLVDAIFVSNFIGVNGLSAVTMGWPLVAFLLGIGLMIGVGSGAASSIEQGKKNKVAATHYIVHYFWLILVFSFFGLWFLSFMGTPVLRFQGAIPEVYVMAKEYLDVFSKGSIIVLGSISAPMIVRNLGAPMFATISVIIGAVTNIILDYVFIVQLSMGIKGAAIATVTGESLTVIVCFLYIFSNKTPLKLSFSSITFKLSYMLHILKLGLSSMITYIYVSLIIILYNKKLMEYGGTVYVSAESLIGYVIGIFYMITEGVASGMQPLTSYFYGARQIKNIKKVLSLGIKTGMFIGVIFMIPALIFPHSIINFFIMFNTDKEMSLQLANITAYAMRINLSVLFLEGFIVVVSMFFQSIDFAGKSIFITILNTVIKIPFLYFFAKLWGTTGVWMVSPICDILISAIVLGLLIMVMKRLNQIMATE